MNRDLKKQSKYQAKYMQKKRMLTVNLDKNKDSDILKWLDKQENRSEAVRKVLKEAAR